MDSDLTSRFNGVLQLHGEKAFERLQSAHIAVIGVGGVGSWTVEALARSGVGRLTLVDLDDVCVSNINRQIHATTDTVGHPKVEVMASRIRAIQPTCHVETVAQFFNASTASAILNPGFSLVIDAIDGGGNKSRLIAECRKRGLPIVVSGSAGGRLDPTRIRTADLVRTSHDRLLAEVRRRLRQEHQFPTSDDPWGIEAVYSLELSRRPVVSTCAAGGNEISTPPDPRADRLNCEAGMGSSVCVTAAFGFAAATLAIHQIIRTPPTPRA